MLLAGHLTSWGVTNGEARKLRQKPVAFKMDKALSNFRKLHGGEISDQDGRTAASELVRMRFFVSKSAHDPGYKCVETTAGVERLIRGTTLPAWASSLLELMRSR